MASIDKNGKIKDIAPFATTGSDSDGVLTVFGDSLDNQVTVSRNAAGQLFVNGGAVPIAGVTPTVANTSLIQVFGQAGNDSSTRRTAPFPTPTSSAAAATIS